MMMRDFGFRIYKALVEAPEVKDDEKDKKKTDKKEDKKDRKDEKDDSRRKDDSNENESDKDDEESDDDYDDDEKRDKKKRKKKKLQMSTHDPYLLLSFVYFDQTHCGYLLEKDVEELFYTLGLMLSRAQVRKLIQKVCKRESLRYRKLTDKPVDAEKPKTEPLRISLEDLAAGNKRYIPCFKAEGGDADSLVSHQGALVDVGKLLEQVERSEKARLETDALVKELQGRVDSLTESASAKDKVHQKLSQDLEDARHRLKATEDDLKRSRQETDRFHKTLCSHKESLQSSLFVIDSVLQRKSRNTRDRHLDTNGLDDSEGDPPSRIKQESEDSMDGD